MLPVDTGSLFDRPESVIIIFMLENLKTSLYSGQMKLKMLALAETKKAIKMLLSAAVKATPLNREPVVVVGKHKVVIS